MSRFYLIKIFTFILLFIFLIGFTFFRKDEYKSKPPAKQPLNQQEETVKEEEKEKELTDEDNIKRIAETFASIYYSYTWGNFSNIELLYNYMTEKMKNNEKERIKDIKNKGKDQPTKYYTEEAKIINSAIINHSDNSTAKLNIDLEIKKINGAFVTDADVPEIKPHTSAFVDGNGNFYDGNIEDLVVEIIEEKVQIDIIKIKNNWRVEGIMKINGYN